MARLFDDAGHQFFLVGGSLRDALLGREPDDLDFATSARPDEIRSVVEEWADAVYGVGEQFGTIGVRKDDQIHEITTFRAEVYRDESGIGRPVRGAWRSRQQPTADTDGTGDFLYG
jgi:poly(A) polymerase